MESNTQINRPRPSSKRLRLLIPFILLFIAGAWFVRKGLREDNQFELTDFTVPVETGRLAGIIKASGELKAIRSVNISPERQGLLAELYVEEGDYVIKGQLIAKMDGGDYQFRLDKLKADSKKERSAFERRKGLYKEGAISREKYEEYLNRFTTSKSLLDQIKVEGTKLQIRAPFSGIITSRYSNPGAFVAPTTRVSSLSGSTSSSIVELSQGLEVVVKVPESDIGRVRLDQDALFRADAFPDKRFKAKVSEIAPRASQTDNVTSFDVTLSLLQPSSLLRIGMNADVEFQTGSTALTTLIPTVAIVTENGEPGVLLVDDKKRPRFQKVELGNSSGKRTAIINGVNPGDLIFIDLPPGLSENRN